MEVDWRIRKLNRFEDCMCAPGIYLAHLVSMRTHGLRKQGLASNSTSVNGYRYNARVMAHHLAETRFGVRLERPTLAPDDVLPYLLSELARAPELWIQKGYLARVLSLDGEIRDDGIVPLEHFIDTAGPDAVAVAVEMDADATIYPAVYIRVGGQLREHALSPHPTRAFDSEAHRRELAACLESVRGLPQGPQMGISRRSGGGRGGRCGRGRGWAGQGGAGEGVRQGWQRFSGCWTT